MEPLIALQFVGVPNGRPQTIAQAQRQFAWSQAG